MSKKDKVQKITFKSVIRLTIFSVLVYFAISFLDQKNSNKKIISDPTVAIDEINESLGGDILGEAYSALPEDSRNQLENFDQTKIGKFFSNSAEYIKQQFDGFPEKQIKEIKKSLIKNVSEEMIRQVEED